MTTNKNMKKMTNYLFVGYVVVATCLLLYSFTQIDLNLTLSRMAVVNTIQHAFQQIGYFNRPLSTYLYIGIVLLLFGLYALTLRAAHTNTITKNTLWKIILAVSVVLCFSYNAFSYDIFNYIFDAKIITYYQQSPYLHKALDFPEDPMVHFMRWTHRTYPYGPSWLIMSVPLSYLGMQLFLPTLILFKLLMVGSYLGTVYFLQRILEKITPTKALFATAFFALNPLMIIETLVSGHHDIVMVLFAVMAFFFLMEKKYGWAILLMAFSVGIKFATVFLVPVFLLLLAKNYKEEQWKPLFMWMMGFMIIPVIVASYRTEMQPWYFLWVLPFIALTGKKWLMLPAGILSFGLLLPYVPFLSTGNYDPPYPMIKTYIIGLTIVVALCVGFILRLNRANREVSRS